MSLKPYGAYVPNDAKITTESKVSRDIYFYGGSWAAEESGREKPTKLMQQDGIVNNPKEQSKIYMRDQMLFFY
jgi:hypothetical protein